MRLSAAAARRWLYAAVAAAAAALAIGSALAALLQPSEPPTTSLASLQAAHAAAGVAVDALATGAPSADLRRALSNLGDRATLAPVAALEAERAIAALRRAERGAAAPGDAIRALAAYRNALADEKAMAAAGAGVSASMTADGARMIMIAVVALSGAVFVGSATAVQMGLKADRIAAMRLTAALAAHADRIGASPAAALAAGGDQIAQLVEASVDREERLQSAIDERFAAETAQAEAAAALRQERDRAETALRELQATQTSLLQAEKMAALGGLVAGVAHEVNTPIGVALTAATFLQRRTKDLQAALAAGKISKSTFTDYLASAGESAALIEKNAARAAELIHSFKMVGVDQTSDARRRIRLGDYLEELTISLGPELKRAGATAHVDAGLDVEIDSYPGAIGQIFTNLVMNSLAHAFPGRANGVITITGTKQDDSLRILYADDGVGLSEETARQVFDPFFTTRRGAGGSGLGMHIVYNLVRSRLGGSIAVEQPAQGSSGARFVLELPCCAPGTAAASIGAA